MTVTEKVRKDKKDSKVNNDICTCFNLYRSLVRAVIWIELEAMKS